MRYWSSRGRARRGDGEGVDFAVDIFGLMGDELIIVRGVGVCDNRRVVNC